MSLLDLFTKKKPIPAPWKKYYTTEELHYKIPNISMYEEVRLSASKYPNYKAIEYMGASYTYRELINKIDKVSISFVTLGIKKGDIVTICLPNVPEALIALYALNKMGAIANMLHPLSAEEEIRQSLESTKSRYLVYLDSFYDKIENIIKKTEVEKVIFVSAADSLNIFKRTAFKISQIGKFKKYPKDKLFMSWRRFVKLSKFKKMETYTKYGKNTPAVILHSGGTSGTPKNVVIQNKSFILGAKQTGGIQMKNLYAGDCCLAIMPNFHGFGLSVLMHTPLSLGCYSILVPKFDAKKFDTLFKQTRPSCVLGVPTLYEALMNCKNEKNLDLSFLKYVVSGGDIIPKALEDKMNAYLKEHGSKAIITQGYGLSECLAAVTLACDDINKSGSVGIPLAGNYIKIIDPDTKKTLPYGEVGEIVINTKGRMLGYLNDEAETNACIQLHDDGRLWVHTGDLGYMDEDGFIFYKGRIKRMIITSGYNVYPSHIEEVIESHPAVLQCTVIGIPHPYKQEVPKAFIVLKEGFHGLFVKSDIRNYCRKNLAKYMIPAEFVFRKQLPKTKLGKVDFKKLQSDIGVDDDEE
jgi:long-chain acyl-CoA synthetase